MIYTELTIKAMNLAYAAHHGQFDKGGVPYIFHPIHLAESMDDEFSCCAALLHDVVEDTDITMEQLSREFPPEVITILKLLTHKDDTDYFDYIRAIRENPAAVKIKLADLKHNSDQSRCEGSDISEVTRERLRQKYQKATAILMK